MRYAEETEGTSEWKTSEWKVRGDQGAMAVKVPWQEASYLNLAVSIYCFT